MKKKPAPKRFQCDRCKSYFPLAQQRYIRGALGVLLYCPDCFMIVIDRRGPRLQ